MKRAGIFLRAAKSRKLGAVQRRQAQERSVAFFQKDWKGEGQGESRCKIRCLFKLQSIEGRFVLLCDKSTKNVGASEMPPHPSTSEGGALREPRAKQSNGFLAYALPSAARRRTPARYCASRPAYAPIATSPARCSAGRAKQYHLARNVNSFPPRGSPRGTPRGQEGGGLCPLPCPANLSVMLTLPCPGALPLPFHLLPGQEGGKGDTCLSPSPFSLPFGKKRKIPRSSMRCRLNQCRGLHLLSPYPRYFSSIHLPHSPCPSFPSCPSS